MKKPQLKQIIKECIEEVSSEEWTKVGQRPPKAVSQIPIGKKTYDEPTFGDNQQLPLMEIKPQPNSVVVLIPGGFKPPHVGHLQLVNAYADNPFVKEVRIMVGPKPREGITREQSIKIWNLLINNPKVKVVSVAFDNPLQAIYEYVFGLPKESTEVVSMGASSKGDDAKKTIDFTNNINGVYKTKGTKNGQRVPNGVTAISLTVDVTPLNYKNRTDGNNGSISASTLRNDLLQKNYNNFKTNYPGIKDNIVTEIYSMLVNTVIKESLKRVIKKMLTEESSSTHSSLVRVKTDNRKYRELVRKDEQDKQKEAELALKQKPATAPTTPEDIKKAKDDKKNKEDALTKAKLNVNAAKKVEDAAKKEEKAVRSAPNIKI